MNKLALNAITLGLLASLPACLAAQETPDPRLAKKITCDSGYKRLHAVVEDISRLSGLPIYCGQGANNWQVRDIPVVVCATDVPAGKLLKTIANTTHLEFSSERADDIVSYRVSRSMRWANKLQAFFDERYADKLARSKQAWDAMIALRDVTPEQFLKTTKQRDANGIDYANRILNCSKVISQLSPSIKERVFNGELVTFNYNQLPAASQASFRSVVESKYRDAKRDDEEFYTKNPGSYRATVPDFQTSELDKCSITVGAQFGGDRDFWGVNITVNTPTGSWHMQAEDVAYLVGNPKGSELLPGIKDMQEQAPAGYQLLLKKEGRLQEVPGLDKEITIEKWTSKTDPTPADFTRALAKATGITIVYEDFFSHSRNNITTLRGLFGSTAKTINLLNTFNHVAGPMVYAPMWLYSEKDSTLIGWAYKWQFRHINMVQANYLDRLKKLLNSTGIGFDDYLSVCALNEGQQWDWIHADPCFEDLVSATCAGPAWKLYNDLTPDQKTLAQSPAGLKLSSFESAAIKPMIDEFNRFAKELADLDGVTPTLVASDDDYLLSLTMRMNIIETTPEHKLRYRIEIQSKDAKDPVAGFDAGRAFPIYSKERQAELDKAAQKP